MAHEEKKVNSEPEHVPIPAPVGLSPEEIMSTDKEVLRQQLICKKAMMERDRDHLEAAMNSLDELVSTLESLPETRGRNAVIAGAMEQIEALKKRLPNYVFPEPDSIFLTLLQEDHGESTD